MSWWVRAQNRAFPPGRSRIKRLAAFALSVFVLYLLIQNLTLGRSVKSAVDDLHAQQQSQLAREDTLLTAIGLLEDQVRQLCAHHAQPCQPVDIPKITPLPTESVGPGTFAPPSQGSGGGPVRGGGSTSSGGTSSSPAPQPSGSSRPPSHSPSPRPTRTPLACVLGRCLPNPLPTRLPLLGATDGGRRSRLLDSRQPSIAISAVSVTDRHRGDSRTGARGYAAASIFLAVVVLVRSAYSTWSGVRRRPPA